MGFLANFGNSKAPQAGQTVFSDVMKYGQMTRQDDLNTLHQARTVQQMQMQQAQEARLLKAQAEKEAADNRTVDMTVHPAFLSLPDEAKQAALKYFSDNGYADKTGKGRAIDIQTGVSTIEGSKKLFDQFMGPVVQQKKQAAVDAWGAVQKAQATGDKDKIAKAQADFNVAKTAYEASDEKYSGHLMKLDEAEAKNAATEKRLELAERREDRMERQGAAREAAMDRRLDIMDKRAEVTGGESKEEKRKVKVRTETRREVEKAYGFSQFLPTAQDPKLLQKVEMGKAIAENIIDNYKDYGLKKEPTPGKAAQLAKEKVAEKFAPKPSDPAEDKKSKSIREILFGTPEKK